MIENLLELGSVYEKWVDKKKKKKRRVWDIWVYVCGAEKTREKKMKHMDERMEILPQYFHNKF